MVSYNIVFSAYIPNTLGKLVEASPIQNVRWGLLPGPKNLLPPLNRFYAFSTDDRSLPHSPGTSRLSLSLTVDTLSTGHLREQLSSPRRDLSHQILVYDSTPKALQQRWTYVSGSIKRQAADVNRQADKIYNQFSRTMTQSVVDAHLSARYPFALSFAIDLDLHVVINSDGQGSQGTLEVTATSNSFPAYELIVNSSLEDWRMPTDPGPSIWNLAGSGSQVLSARRYF
jgi:hypothetical protein